MQALIDKLKQRIFATQERATLGSGDDALINQSYSTAYRDALSLVQREVDVVQTFLYLLLRDELSAGKVEVLVSAAQAGFGKETRYSNPHVAAYAAELRYRLLEGKDPPATAADLPTASSPTK